MTNKHPKNLPHISHAFGTPGEKTNVKAAKTENINKGANIMWTIQYWPRKLSHNKEAR